MFPDPKYYMVGFTCCPPEERKVISRPVTEQKGVVKDRRPSKTRSFNNSVQEVLRERTVLKPPTAVLKYKA